MLTPVAVAWIAARYGWRPAVAITAVVGFVADLFGWAVSFGALIAMLAVVGCLLVANWATGSRY